MSDAVDALGEPDDQQHLPEAEVQDLSPLGNATIRENIDQSLYGNG